jgi:hypothetical protein
MGKVPENLNDLRNPRALVREPEDMSLLTGVLFCLRLRKNLDRVS